MPPTEDVYLVSTGTSLPAPVSAEEAMRSGVFDRRSYKRCQVESVRVAADGESPGELAAAAATSALQRSGSRGADIALILHACVYHQGREVWPPASYVQRVAVGNSCPAVELRQMSNGGMAALHMGVGYLASRPAGSEVLITTGDTFPLPGFDRWNSDPGTVFADGGTAAVLSNQDGFARIHSVAMASDSSLEPMHNGTDPFTASAADEQPLDFDRRKRQFLDEVGMQFAIDRVDVGQQVVVEQALADAGAKLDDVDWFVLPAFGRRRLDLGLFGKFAIPPERSTWPWARQVGHLGAGDQIAGLDHLITSGQARPGQLCLLVGVGGGFSWSASVVEVRSTPSWNRQTPSTE